MSKKNSKSFGGVPKACCHRAKLRNSKTNFKSQNTMKTQILALMLLLLSLSTAFAQKDSLKKNELVMYSFIVNRTPDNFNIPLIGFINIANGNHKSAEVGFVNYTKGNFTGGQISFINTVGENCIGSQIGFVNTTVKKFKGSQIGFVNTTLGDFFGSQVGFVNTSAKKSDNIQIGFVNTCGDSLRGAQVGFVNTSLKRTVAPQIGLINVAKSLKGTQIGLVNFVDSIESGVPLGLLSIVRKGGYHAIELSVNEMYPLNLSYKIGIPELYTSFVISYNPKDEKNVAIGAGLGSIIPLGKRLCFNPEFTSQTLFFNEFQQYTNASANIGYKLNNHVMISAGPSLTYQYNYNKNSLNEPLFSFSESNWRNGTFITGARVAVRYKF